VASRPRTVTLDGGRTVEVRETTLLQLGSGAASERERLLVWQLYWIDGTLTAKDHTAKLLGAWHRLMGRGDDGAAIVLYAPDTEARPADAALKRFAGANLTAIERALAATRASR
jgi:EpsI family protein